MRLLKIEHLEQRSQLWQIPEDVTVHAVFPWQNRAGDPCIAVAVEQRVEPDQPVKPVAKRRGRPPKAAAGE